MPNTSDSRPRLSLPWLAVGFLANLVLPAPRSGAAKTSPSRPPARPQQSGTASGKVSKNETGASGAFGEQRSVDEPAEAHEARAKEPGRGREADSPEKIPFRGWKDIFWRVVEEIGKDRLLAVAAGVVFYSLLAVVPTITALVSSYGLFADVSTIGEHLSIAAGILPQASFDLLKDQVLRIAGGSSGGGLTLGFIFGFGLALWSANAGMKAIFDALNVIYDEDEKRSFIRLNLISLSFTLGAIAMMLLAVGAVVVFPIILGTFGITAINPLIISILRWPILFALVIFALAVLYRYGPSRRDAKWRWVSVGSVFAAFAWIAASLGFSYYLSNFADYNATYGSLGAVMGLMMWMWLTSIVVLVGAEINAETEHQTARDTTRGAGERQPEKTLGTRGAAMADTVGVAKT